ncbi:hypothetical protein A606_06770 [Corynebacterium terpenotabidum Y-11]|uniref:TM2 domain-containing protein n=1 Tax=Corynebacterium terpenotabidum Y-11 TaxID=1200352 RepID=S4XEP6_9CORY|nr:hypothetical protein A606_06770 [Corynebacterium terpenotabidum Y-11]
MLGFFFGTLGAHNFYFGKTGRAVAQLAMTIIGWLLLFSGMAVVQSGVGDTYSSYSSYTYSSGSESLIVVGMILVIIAIVMIAVVSIWAFVEFVMILAGARTYAFDNEGRAVQ